MVAPESNIPGFGKVRFSTYNSASAGLSLQQPLWLAGKVGMALDAARTYRKIARAALTAGRSSLKSEVIKEYFGLLLAREVERVTAATIDQTSRHADMVQKMFEVGMASEFDQLRAQVEVKSLEPQLERARQGAELAHLALKNRLGVNPEDELVLSESLEESGDTSFFSDPGQAFSAAVSTRPEFKIMNYQDILNGISLKAEKRSIYWPNFFLGLGLSSQASEDKLNYVASGDSWTHSATWTVAMQVPLFDGFATSAKIQQARIGIRRAKLNRLLLEQGVRMEVSATLSELRRASKQVASQRTGVELAEKALGIARTRFEQGVGTELEVQDAQLALHGAQIGHLQGLFDLRVAQAEYSRVVENDDNLEEEDK
jgi:outer membrane protein TolC